jgi:two-component system, cell cycle response regulator DivK
MKILLVEDSRFLRVAMEKALTRAGHEVRGIADGRETVLAARSNRPAIILLDMMLPGLDGICVLKDLKEDATTAHIPVIVLSGLSQKNEARLIKAGAAAYIEKSSLDLTHNAAALIRAIENVITTARKILGGDEDPAGLSSNVEATKPKIQTVGLSVTGIAG